MNDSMVESVCIFGSTARNSTDDLSDRDVLVVAGDRHRREEIAAHWSRNGWSVASYSPRRLRQVIRAGSLFVQHLKLEGIIVVDKGGWLSDSLRRAVPKNSYMKDAFASVSLAKPVERFHPNATISDLLTAADIAYVSIRNFGVCFLASRGKVSFDYRQIVAELRSEFRLAQSEFDLLMSLRLGKSCYRKGINCTGIEGDVRSLTSVLSKFFGSGGLNPIDPKSPVRKLQGGYSTLRDFEAAVVSRAGGVPTKAEMQRIGTETVWRWVTQPSEYAWCVRKCDAAELEYLLEGNGGFAPVPIPTSTPVQYPQVRPNKGLPQHDAAATR